MSNPIHHIHKRKRVHEKLEKYPHPNNFKKIMDKFIFIVGVLGPAMAIPQVYKIYSAKNASSISLFSFSAYVFMDIIWLVYGILHKEKPIILVYSLWAIINSIIAVGAILYS